MNDLYDSKGDLPVLTIYFNPLISGLKEIKLAPTSCRKNLGRVGRKKFVFCKKFLNANSSFFFSRYVHGAVILPLKASGYPTADKNKLLWSNSKNPFKITYWRVLIEKIAPIAFLK